MQLDQLDKLANETFAGRVVRKDLVRQVKVGANVPVYVLEFLLGKYCASDDPFAIETGLMVVNQTLKDNFIRPDESELAKARVKQKGQYRLIDKVDVPPSRQRGQVLGPPPELQRQVRPHPRESRLPVRPITPGRSMVANWISCTTPLMKKSRNAPSTFAG